MTVYDLEGKMLSTLELKIAVLTSTFSVEADAAVVGFNDGSVQVWNLEKKERIGGDWAAFNKPLGDLGITPDKKKIVVADSECNVKIYDIDGKKVLKEFKCHEAAMSGLMISRDGQRFATIADNAEVKLWDIDGKELRSWKLPSAARSMAFSVDGKKLITANLDSTLTVLNLP
jgi:WD40 repeat protein